MKIRWWLCIWLWIFHSNLYAQHSNQIITGTIYDENKSPLPGATVFIEDLHRGEVTDLDGKFIFQRIPTGNYRLVVRFTGYQAQYPEITVPQQKSLELTLLVDDLLLKNITVEGQALSSNTIPETSLSGKELESTRGESLTESLEKIAGVNSLQTGSSIAKPMLHGLHSNRILILNNGVRMEGQQWGVEHAPEIDPFTASKLSVLKGAASVKYGPEAIGGVVIVSPPDLPTTSGISGEANLIGMSNGRSGTGSARVEGGLPGLTGFGWRLQGTLKHAGDAQAPNYNLTNTGVQESDISAGIGYQANTFGINMYYSHFGTKIGILKSTGLIGSLSDLQDIISSERPSVEEGFSYSIENPRQEVTHNLFKLNGYYQANIGRFTLQYALQFNHRKEFDIRRGALNDIPSMNLEIATHTVNLELKHNPVGDLEGSVGIDMMYQNNKNIPGTQRSYFIPNHSNYSGGIYWIESWIKDQWELEAGLRYDVQHYQISGWNINEGVYDDAFGFHNLTASVGGVFNFNEYASFTTNIGSAWRPPHVAELYSFGKHQSTAGLEYGLLWQWDRAEPPPNNFYIQPFDEANIQNEKGIKWMNTYAYASERFSTEISAYANWIGNYIFLRPEGITESNVGALPYYWYRQTNALFAGVDVSINYQLTSALAWQSKLSYLRAKDVKNNDELPFIPANQISTSLRYEKEKWMNLEDAFAQIGISYTDKQRHAPRIIPINELFEAARNDTDIFINDSRNFDLLPAPDGYALVNLETGGSKKVGDEATLHLRLGVHNLFNVSYRNYTNRLRYYTDEAGRNFVISLKYSF